MSKAKIITSILIGAVTGATLGILFAPAKGSKTRKKLMRRKEDFKDALQDKVSQFVDEITEQYENVKSQASNLMQNGKEKASAVKADGKHSLS
jgi:gas vesicle protein